MRFIGLLIDKQLRNTVFAAVILHAFCLFFVSFTFQDKINFPMDLNVDFLGPLLGEIDVFSDIGEGSYSKIGISPDFLAGEHDTLQILDYHLAANKPSRGKTVLFSERKNSSKVSYLFSGLETRKKEEPTKIETIEQAPDWERELKLKIE